MMLNQKVIVKFIDRLACIKSRFGIKVIDTHLHPLDVMGVRHFRDPAGNGGLRNARGSIPANYPAQITFPERMMLCNFSQRVINMAFRFLPTVVAAAIRTRYARNNEAAVLERMQSALIDKAVLVPLEPWAPVQWILKRFPAEQFYYLGSIDVHNWSLEQIARAMDQFGNHPNIIGIKLHPNLQNFKPQPSDNPPVVAEKLRLIYGRAEQKALYLLFHSGRSNLLDIFDQGFKPSARSTSNALITQFCDKKGSSEIFGVYNVPIVLAHLGHYGLSRFNLDCLRQIINRYPNVYFDTSAVSPNRIAQYIKTFGSDRLIFGTDGLYNNLVHSLFFVYLAVQKAGFLKHMETLLVSLLGGKFYTSIAQYQRRSGSSAPQFYRSP